MNALQRAATLLLLSILATIAWAGIAHAQSGDSKAPAAYDYVADATDEWTTKYGNPDGSGDWRYYRNELYDAGHKEKIGWADGYCIESVPGEWSYCTWSLYTHTLTLSAHGVWDEKAQSNQFAIAGGTGDYTNVHGNLHIATNQDASQYYFTVEKLEVKQELASFKPLNVIADARQWKTTYFADPASSYSNVWYWHEPAYSDDEEKTQIGSSDGYCISTGPNQAAECLWTVTGDGWSVSAAGRKYDEGQSALTITGGSGEYAGATGTATWETSPDGAKSSIRYNFDHLLATLHKPYHTYVEGSGFLYGDTPPKPDPKGDLYYWHAPLWNTDKSAKIGWSDGFCVITAPQSYSACTLTLYTDSWTLTASGPHYETDSPSLMAVTGGTGAYANVAGTITISGTITDTISGTLKGGQNNAGYDIAMDLTVAPYSYWGGVPYPQATPDERANSYTLGWNEANWDSSRPAAIPDTQSRSWAELTALEQQAATTAGYDESTWNAFTVRKPKGDPEPYWSQYNWDDLYLSEQRLWGILGWNASNWSGIPEAALPNSDLRTWDKLTAVEQGAATELGYEQKSWDAHIVRTPVGDVEPFWSQFKWKDLSEGERLLFAYLGWDAERWAGNQPTPESKYQTWKQLSPVEQGAATQLGYGEETWDATVLKH